MKTLWWETQGEGDCHLVLLHGWGLNTQVWHCISSRLASQFTLHMVDLPGFGRSQGYGAMSLTAMADRVMQSAPERAIWLGWSLGGLVASQAALACPQRVSGLITVASSPCFSAKDDWPGIKPATLAGFQQQLREDYHHTVARFLALQTLGTETAHQDVRLLKDAVINQPMPSIEVLNGGLDILQQEDLREALCHLRVPFLRLYGRLDGLVPRNVAARLDALWPQSSSQIFPKAGHAPFISHPEDFCNAVFAFRERCQMQH